MPETDEKRVLICPMDWGIGHATRCVPVIRKLEELGFTVIIAASGRPLDFLRKELPHLAHIEFPGKKVTYPKNGRIVWRMMKLLPGLLAGIRREHRRLLEIAEKTGAGLIISDNRYGCWHPTIPSVFITHQLDLRVPAGLGWLQPVLRRINYRFIRRYAECWIPDFELHRGLAGALSHPAELPPNAYYIGILSRFAGLPAWGTEGLDRSFDLLVMISGPEPQRTILEEKILMQLVNIDLQVAIVRGVTESDEAYVIDDRIHVFSHLETPRMRELIDRSDLVICRSGYSSIMDLVTLGKRAIFIPTPGQTEQEYLAKYLKDKKICFSMNQDEFNLLYALEMSKNYPGMVIRNDHTALAGRIRAVMPKAKEAPSSPAR